MENAIKNRQERLQQIQKKMQEHVRLKLIVGKVLPSSRSWKKKARIGALDLFHETGGFGLLQNIKQK